MKITASRRDDILRQRDEYDARINQINKHLDDLSDQRRDASYKAAKALEQRVSDIIGPTTLNLQIRAREDYLWGRNIPTGERLYWSITINANDSNKFSDNVALAWNMDIKLDKEGNIVKDSSSWSGLKAVTPEQIADLEESVRVIKILNNINWDEIVNAPTISYDDYTDKAELEERKQLKDARPDFEAQLRTADLEEYIGSDVLIKINPDYENAYYRKGLRLVILPTKDSGNFITGYLLPELSTREHIDVETIKQRYPEVRVRKDKLLYGQDGYQIMELH